MGKISERELQLRALAKATRQGKNDRAHVRQNKTDLNKLRGDIAMASKKGKPRGRR